MSGLVERLLDAAEKAKGKGNHDLCSLLWEASDELGLSYAEIERLRGLVPPTPPRPKPWDVGP